MDSFDFESIEYELQVQVPHVYRNFMTQAREMGIVFPDYEFPNTAGQVVGLNRELKEVFSDIWRPELIALLPDGCGNHFAMVASSADSDEIVIIAHDPYGIEPFCSANELFAGYVNFDNPHRQKASAQ